MQDRLPERDIISDTCHGKSKLPEASTGNLLRRQTRKQHRSRSDRRCFVNINFIKKSDALPADAAGDIRQLNAGGFELIANGIGEGKILCLFGVAAFLYPCFHSRVG